MFGGYPGMYDSDNSCYSDDDEDDDDDDESVDEILQRMAQSYRKKSESKNPLKKVFEIPALLWLVACIWTGIYVSV